MQNKSEWKYSLTHCYRAVIIIIKEQMIIIHNNRKIFVCLSGYYVVKA